MAAVVGTIVVFAVIAGFVLLMIGGFRSGSARADANKYLADRYRDEKRSGRR